MSYVCLSQVRVCGGEFGCVCVNAEMYVFTGVRLWACMCASVLAGALLCLSPQSAGAGAKWSCLCCSGEQAAGSPSVSSDSQGLSPPLGSFTLSQPEWGFCTMWGYWAGRGKGGWPGCGEVYLSGLYRF